MSESNIMEQDIQNKIEIVRQGTYIDKVLIVNGQPGCGKTFTSAAVIAALLKGVSGSVSLPTATNQ